MPVGGAATFVYPPRTPHDPPRASDAFDGLREALESLAPKHRPGVEPNKATIGTVLNRYKERVFLVDEVDSCGAEKKGVSRCMVSVHKRPNGATLRGGAAWRCVDPTEKD